MVEIERLGSTAELLISRLNEGGLSALDQALNTTRKTSATYRYTYDRYLQYFRDKPSGGNLTEQDLYVGFGIAYSWMATIKQLDPRIKTVEAAVKALNQVRVLQPTDLELGIVGCHNISPDKIARVEMMIEPIRQFLGSVIGSSKLLHFVNPDVFPMWDSVIHRYFNQLEQKSASDSLHQYIEYTYNVHALISDDSFEGSIYEPLTSALVRAYQEASDQYRMPDKMGKVRAIEFLMFFGGKIGHQAYDNQLRERGWRQK
jgi:hypothetical protein